MERHGVNEVHVNANSCHLAEPAEAPALPRTRTRRRRRSPVSGLRSCLDDGRPASDRAPGDATARSGARACCGSPTCTSPSPGRRRATARACAPPCSAHHRVRRLGYQLSGALVADLSSGGPELVKIGCEQPLKACRISTARKAQRLIIRGNGLGDLPISSDLLDDQAHTPMLAVTTYPSHQLSDRSEEHTS